MDFYQKPYLYLFNSITDALRAMDDQNYGLARDLLIRAHQEAENYFLEEDPQP